MATSAALRQINQARILNTLRKGSWSRVALAEELGLNRSTVTVIISGLLEQGWSVSWTPRRAARRRTAGPGSGWHCRAAAPTSAAWSWATSC